MALPAGATRKNVNSRRIVNTFHGKPPLAGLAHDDDDDDDIILNFFIVANARVDVGVVIVIVPRDVSQHRPGAALAAGSHARGAVFVGRPNCNWCCYCRRR
jgi:hypothetical protein